MLVGTLRDIDCNIRYAVWVLMLYILSREA